MNLLLLLIPWLTLFLSLCVFYSYPLTLTCPEMCECFKTEIDCSGSWSMTIFPDMSDSPVEVYQFRRTGIRHLDCSRLGPTVSLLNVKETKLEQENFCELSLRCDRLKGALFLADFDEDDCSKVQEIDPSSNAASAEEVKFSEVAATTPTPYRSKTDTLTIDWSLVACLCLCLGSIIMICKYVQTTIAAKVQTAIATQQVVELRRRTVEQGSQTNVQVVEQGSQTDRPAPVDQPINYCQWLAPVHQPVVTVEQGMQMDTDTDTDEQPINYGQWPAQVHQPVVVTVEQGSQTDDQRINYCQCPARRETGQRSGFFGIFSILRCILWFFVIFAIVFFYVIVVIYFIIIYKTIDRVSVHVPVPT